jgi:hypothetical protein
MDDADAASRHGKCAAQQSNMRVLHVKCVQLIRRRSNATHAIAAVQYLHVLGSVTDTYSWVTDTCLHAVSAHVRYAA